LSHAAASSTVSLRRPVGLCFYFISKDLGGMIERGGSQLAPDNQLSLTRGGVCVGTMTRKRRGRLLPPKQMPQSVNTLINAKVSKGQTFVWMSIQACVCGGKGACAALV